MSRSRRTRQRFKPCRSGTCPWCDDNRMFFDRKRREPADVELRAAQHAPLHHESAHAPPREPADDE